MKKLSAMIAMLLVVAMLMCGCGAQTPAAQPAAPAAQPAAPAEQAAVTPEEAPAAVEYKQMNEVNSNPLSDVRVRMAIAYAIDMDAIAESFFKGMVNPANSLTPANGLDLNNYSYDPDKAIELLKEANWDENYTLKVVYTYTDQETVDLMAIVQQYLAAVGIKMEATLLEGDTSALLWTKPEDGVNGPSAVDWDMYYGAIAASSQYSFYTRFLTGGSNNSYSPGNEELDAMINAVNNTAEAAEQTKLFNDIQIFLNENLPVLPLYHMDVYSIESDRMNRNGAPYGNEQYSYDWKVETWDVEANSDGVKVLTTNHAPAEYFWEPFQNANGNLANKFLYDHLVVANSDCNEFAGQQTESFEISPDGTSVKFVLKEGLKWHDGSDITAEDVKFTWELAAKVSSLHALYTDMVKKLEGYKEFTEGTADEITGIVIDGNTITFNFTAVSPTMMMGFSQLPTLPKKYLEKADPAAIQQDSFWQSPVGSGPFKINTVSMNNYVILEAFEEYHDGRPMIDQIYMYPSTETDANLVKNVSAGLYDYAWSKSVADVVACGDIDGYTVSSYPMLYSRLFYYNRFEHAN